jgi:hypothetical protein
MKPILAFAAAAIVIAGVSTVHGNTKGVTALDISAYKAAVEAACRDQGRRLRHSWEQVGRRCNCVVETLNSRLTQEEWKRATSFAQQRKDQDEAKVLAPHMPAVKGCEKNAAGK